MSRSNEIVGPGTRRCEDPGTAVEAEFPLAADARWLSRENSARGPISACFSLAAAAAAATRAGGGVGLNFICCRGGGCKAGCWS